MLKKSLIAIVLLMISGCQPQEREWNPIFEDTHFNYFNARIEKSLALVDELVGNPEESPQENLELIRQQLLKLKDYYIPITTVRQDVYDAERYLKIKDTEKAKELLMHGRSTVASLLSGTDNPIFDKVVVDLTSAIDETLASLNHNDVDAAYTRLETLGAQVNQMLYKGELVLSGIEFEK
nr:hypothetical protein [uncultured Desulfobacter sp.]